jgi:ArsR family transcriptional regulator, virulence genes transcriptional regulator
MGVLMKNGHVQLHKNIDKAETLLKLMANSARLLVLCNLSSGEKNVTELVKAVKLSQPAVSQHLARMRYEGLVNAVEKIYTKPEKGSAVEVAAPRVAASRPIAKKVEKPKAAAKPAKKKAPEPTQLSFLG